MLSVTGPNGAGKSSLLRLVVGLLRPDAGTIEFDGSAAEEPVAHYLGHQDALKPSLTLAETLRFWSAVYGQGGVAPDSSLTKAAELVGLGHALYLHVGVLSAGQRRRAALARVILSPRPLWVLDEPSAALDSDGEALLRLLMHRHIESGGLIVAATHQALPLQPDSVLELGAT